MNQKEVIKKLVEKSWADPQFKAEFIADPVAVIQRETGKTLNLNGKEIVVMDQSDTNTYYLNLSRYVNNRGLADQELTDEQLDKFFDNLSRVADKAIEGLEGEFEDFNINE